MVLATSNFLQNFVIGHGSNPSNRRVGFMVFLQDKLIGLCLAYAPNSSTNRCTPCDWMASSLRNVEWILGDDFNMVEWVGDKNGGVDSVISRAKKHAWTRCKAILQVVDINWKKKSMDCGG